MGFLWRGGLGGEGKKWVLGDGEVDRGEVEGRMWSGQGFEDGVLGKVTFVQQSSSNRFMRVFSIYLFFRATHSTAIIIPGQGTIFCAQSSQT